MAGLLERLRKDVISVVWKDKTDRPKAKDIDDKIALGMILWGVGAVAEADEKFLPEEDKKIKQLLLSYTKISKQDFPIVLTAIRQSAIGKFDFYRFVREISKNLLYNVKMSIIENLFRVGCADRDLNNNELEVINKVAGLFQITHKDLTEIKIKIKEKFNLVKRAPS